MYKIRNVRKDDLEDLRKINMAVSSNPNKTKEQWEMSFIKYLDYYAIYAADTSFCIVDDEDHPLGYILCESSATRYFENMKKYYKVRMEELEPGSFDEFVRQQEYKLYETEYPAHLHIDILPAMQGQHAGTRLMNRLIEKLKEKGVHGLILGMDKRRPAAVSFYKKNGFKIIEENKYSYLMGQKF